MEQGARLMKDYQASMQKLRTDAAEAALVSDPGAALISLSASSLGLIGQL
jgi:hypothetical protein